MWSYYQGMLFEKSRAYCCLARRKGIGRKSTSACYADNCTLENMAERARIARRNCGDDTYAYPKSIRPPGTTVCES